MDSAIVPYPYKTQSEIKNIYKEKRNNKPPTHEEGEGEGGGGDDLVEEDLLADHAGRLADQQPVEQQGIPAVVQGAHHHAEARQPA